MGLAVLGALIFAGLTALPAFDRFHGLDIDLLHFLEQKLIGGTHEDGQSRTVVVALDEETYATAPFAGLPKVMWTPQIGAVQDAILDGGARVVGWDLILPTSAATYVADRNFDKPLLKSLARARRSGQVVLGSVQLSHAVIAPHPLFSWAAGGSANLRSLNVSVDPDGVIRGLPTFVAVQKKDGSRDHVPTMATELAARLKGKQPVRSASGGVSIGGQSIPGVKSDILRINFTAPSGRIPTYSFVDLYKCRQAGKTDFFKEHFDGKVVLFGLVLDIEERKITSNRLITDGRPNGATPKCIESQSEAAAPTSRRETISGVFIHAVAVNNLLRGDGLRQFDPLISLLFAMSLAIAIAIVTLLLRPVIAVSILFAASLIWAGLATALFQQAIVLPLVDPVTAGALSFVGVLGFRFAVVDKSSRFLRKAFESYVAPELVEALVADPEKLRLGGERREMSFLFTDLAGFTGLIEHLDPSDVAPLLNSYLDEMIQIAKRNEGTIDKVIGDALVVIFSAPVGQVDHAMRAVKTASELDVFAQKFAANQQANGLPFGQTRIGVHSGVAVVGNFGGTSFFDYTALGDAMNTAARLESVNKHLGTRVLVSGETVKKCPGFNGRPAGHLILKGKTKPIEVFEPIDGALMKSPAINGYLSAYSSAERKDPAAAQNFRKLAENYPDDKLVQFHWNRLRDGETGMVIEMEEK